MPRPVAVARELADHGVSLRKAHEAIDRLVAGQAYAVEVIEDNAEKLIHSLRPLGIEAALLRKPEIEAKQVREVFGLSQKDFARRFGLEVRTVQNWEQNRYGLDSPTRILLALIRENPEAVERVLTRPASP